MGLDLLDLTFRLEKHFGIRIGKEDWLQFSGDDERFPFDVTAGEVWKMVESKVGEGAERIEPQTPPSPDGVTAAPVLSYETPRPLTPFDGPDTRWHEVRTVIAATLRVPIDKVQRDTLLKRDLGAEW